MNKDIKASRKHASKKYRRSRWEKNINVSITIHATKENYKRLAWLWRQVCPTARIHIRRGPTINVRAKNRNDALAILKFGLR